MTDYDKALERARKELKQDLHESGIWAIQRIFPELRESEDEQALRIIRKRMCYDPAPISDEDRRIVETWLEKQKDSVSNAKYIEDVAHTFEDGRKKEMQMPAEWSEGDEAMRDNILRVLSCFVGTTECKSNPSLSTSYPLYRREIVWLKSLPMSCPKKSDNWKPSEEQMMALLNAEGFLRAGLQHDSAKTIAELYEQLKSIQ